MKRPLRRIRKSSFLQNLEPELPAAQSQLVHCPVRLSDRPDHSKISDRCAQGLRVSFEYHDSLASAGGREGVCESENSGSDDGDVRFVFHYYDPLVFPI